MDSIKNKLEELKSLFDSKLISEKEYESLKKEILFEDNSIKQLEKDLDKDSITNEIYDINPTKLKSNSIGIYIVIGLCVAFYFAFVNSKDNTNYSSSVDSESTNADVPETETSYPTEVCGICGKTFHNRGYEEVSEGVYKEIEEGQGTICSESCARKHTQDLIDLGNKYSSSPNNSIIHQTGNSDYYEGSDGMIYENSPCDLCRGTGYEINTAQHVLGGPNRRICPMCQGKGVKSY